MVRNVKGNNDGDLSRTPNLTGVYWAKPVIILPFVRSQVTNDELYPYFKILKRIIIFRPKVLYL